MLCMTGSIDKQTALRPDCNGKLSELIEGHYSEVVVYLYCVLKNQSHIGLFVHFYFQPIHFSIISAQHI